MKKIFFLLLLISTFAKAQVGNQYAQPWFYAIKYGCIGDGIVTVGTTTATSPNVKIPNAHFLTNSPVGKKFRVQGGGTSNVDQILTCSSVLNDTVAVMSGNVTSSKTLTTVDYGTDNTTPIQNLFITVVNAGGGRIIFAKGVYLIFGSLQTSVNSVNPNCQIYFPLTNPSSTAIVQLDIEGEFRPQILLPISVPDFTNAQQKSTIFKSEIDGANTLPSVFGTPYFFMTDVGANYNYTSVRMRNIILETKSQSNNAEISGTMCGINAGYLNQFGIEDAFIGNESILYNTATQASNATYGIVFPYFLNNAYSLCDKVTFAGYHWGYKASDHFDGGLVTSIFCWYALEYNNGTPGNINFVGHDAVIKHLQIELCPKGINVTGESGLRVVLWSGERDVSGNWYQTTGNDVDFTGSGLSGTVTVNAIDMELSGVPDYGITSNNYSRFKLRYNNNRDVENYMQPLTDSATVHWNLIAGKRAILTLSQNTTLSIINAAAGDRVSLEVNQNGTGGFTLAPSTNSYSNTGTFTPSPAPVTSSFFEGVFDGLVWIWNQQNITGLPTNNPATGFIAALTVAGYIPGTTEANGYDSFYVRAVRNGYWSKLHDFYTFSGTSAATQAINFLNTSAYTITWNGGNTFNSSGYTGNATNGYGDTGFNPFVVLASNNSAAFGMWTTTTTTPSFATLGVYTGTGNTPDMQMGFNYDGTHSFGSIAGVTDLITINNPSPYSGMFTVSRTASNLVTMYQGTTSLGTATGTSRTALPSDNFYIGARKANGAAAQFSAQTYIFLFIADGLTSTDVTNLNSDLSALKTAMGR